MNTLKKWCAGSGKAIPASDNPDQLEHICPECGRSVKLTKRGMTVEKLARHYSVNSTTRADEPKPQISPATVREKRMSLGLTQTEAARIVSSSLRTWQDWEGGKNKMPHGKWELFCLKTGNKS